jgi:hypothetical protein
MICELLLMAIMAVETGGHPDPLNASGDNGASIGCMQIQKAVIDDVNRVYKTDFYYSDRNSYNASMRIAELYLTYWGKIYERKTGKKPTNEIYARIWNGGAYGWKKGGKAKANLDKYWAKIQKEISKCTEIH